VLVLIALTCVTFAIFAPPAIAAPVCEWFPSSDCPVPGGSRTSPCYSDQIKANWTTGLYYLPWQSTYRAAGGYGDIWCFDYERDAIDYGFRRA
jgi:hypothetical protein